MKTVDNCPHCGVSLIGEPIPQELLDKGYYSTTHWRREIGMEYPELYDGVWEWMCPDCNGKWDSVVKKLRRNDEAK